MADIGIAVTDESLRLIYDNQLLQELDLSYCNKLTSEFLEKFSAKFKGKDIAVLRLDGMKGNWPGESFNKFIEKIATSLRV